MKKHGKLKKIVLAYSGGLDTTAAIPWLIERTGAEVVAMGVDVGQPEDLDAAVEKAFAAGASKAFFIDARDEFASGYVFPAIKANALYEGEYPLVSSLSRPLIAGKLAETAVAEGADAVAHGCTGKGNDQVRFETTLAALAPRLEVLAPARHWGFSRDETLKFSQQHGIPVEWETPPYSIDENLWGRAIECCALEDAWAEPMEDAFLLTADPFHAPDDSCTICLEFEKGLPVKIDGMPMGPQQIIRAVGKIAGKHGFGRIDMIENRTVGIKSREVYECPAALALIRAHKALESMVLTKAVSHLKAQIDTAWANMAYGGQWHTPLRKALDAFIGATQEQVTGTVRMRFYKGSMAVTGRKSPYSLYDEGIATYGAGDSFDHAAADGFLKILTMETRTLALKAEALGKGDGGSCDEVAHVAEQAS